jgi:hypothetical protein
MLTIMLVFVNCPVIVYLSLRGTQCRSNPQHSRRMIKGQKITTGLPRTFQVLAMTKNEGLAMTEKKLLNISFLVV